MAIIREGGAKYLVNIGIDIGQIRDPTAVVVADPEIRDKELHYLIRFLKRLPLGLAYPSIIEDIRRIYGNIPKPEGLVIDPDSDYSPRKWKIRLERGLWIDATGVGKPVVDMLAREIPEADDDIHAVFLTGGEAREEVNVWGREVKLPKAYLVSRLQVLFGCNRVHLPPNDREAQAMKVELMNYQIKANENANAQFGAFKVGTHDDLVTALGLACLSECDSGFSIY